MCCNKLFTHVFLPNCLLLVEALLQQSRTDTDTFITWMGMQTPCSCMWMRSQTVVPDKRTSIHHIKGHNFLLLLSVLSWKDKSTGEEPRCCWGRCSSQDTCCCCLSPRLAAFPLFSETIDKKLVQTGLPEFIYCTLLNFPLLSSSNKEA